MIAEMHSVLVEGETPSEDSEEKKENSSENIERDGSSTEADKSDEDDYGSKGQSLSAYEEVSDKYLANGPHSGRKIRVAKLIGCSTT